MIFICAMILNGLSVNWQPVFCFFGGLSDSEKSAFAFYKINKLSTECRLPVRRKLFTPFFSLHRPPANLLARGKIYGLFRKCYQNKKIHRAASFRKPYSGKIAAQAGYSTFHYCRVFKENTGKSLMRYVREKRLEAAKKEIQSGEAAADVAQKYGFETTSGFLRAYKKEFGKRPSEENNN